MSPEGLCLTDISNILKANVHLTYRIKSFQWPLLWLFLLLVCHRSPFKAPVICFNLRPWRDERGARLTAAAAREEPSPFSSTCRRRLSPLPLQEASEAYFDDPWQHFTRSWLHLEFLFISPLSRNKSRTLTDSPIEALIISLQIMLPAVF